MTQETLKRIAMVLGGAVALWIVFALVRTVRGDDPITFSLPKVDTTAVDSVTIIRQEDTAVLVRNGADWVVNGHKATPSLVMDLLRSLSDTAAWSELVAQNKSSHEKYGVSSDSGRHFRIVSKGKPVVQVVTGRRTTDWSGIYIRQHDEDAVYAVHSTGLVEGLTRMPDEWRDKKIVAVAGDSVAEIQLRRGNRTSVIARDSTGWKLNGAAADSGQVASLLDEYRQLEATGFPTTPQLDSINFNAPKASIRMTAKGGAVLASVLFDSTAGGVWVRAESGGAVFRVDPWKLSRLAPPDSTLKARK